MIERIGKVNLIVIIVVFIMIVIAGFYSTFSLISFNNDTSKLNSYENIIFNLKSSIILL